VSAKNHYKGPVRTLDLDDLGRVIEPGEAEAAEAPPAPASGA